MKRTLSLALLVLTATTIFAAESKNTPPTSEQITYNGKEYVKRYKYEHFFSGYGSTIYPKGEARADSLREVVVEENRVRRENNLQSSAIFIQDLNEFAKIIRKSFTKKELRKLRQGDDEHAAVFVTNIIVNKNREIEHCALAYVGSSIPNIDSRIIALQEKIRDAITLHFPEEVLSVKVSTKDSDRSKHAAMIQKSRKGDLKMSELKELIPIEKITKITDENREAFDYYFLGQRISYNNIINGYGY